jgi:hypothetical protein
VIKNDRRRGPEATAPAAAAAAAAAQVIGGGPAARGDAEGSLIGQSPSRTRFQPVVHRGFNARAVLDGETLRERVLDGRSRQRGAALSLWFCLRGGRRRRDYVIYTCIYTHISIPTDKSLSLSISLPWEARASRATRDDFFLLIFLFGDLAILIGSQVRRGYVEERAKNAAT